MPTLEPVGPIDMLRELFRRARQGVAAEGDLERWILTYVDEIKMTKVVDPNLVRQARVGDFLEQMEMVSEAEILATMKELMGESVRTEKRYHSLPVVRGALGMVSQSILSGESLDPSTEYLEVTGRVYVMKASL